MSARRIGCITLLATIVATPGLAQDRSPISGSVSLGARSVDVDGALGKYREDVNLDDGVRLLDASLSYVPDSDDDAPIDRIDLDAHNLGGDPFETISFSVRKYGAFELELDRRRSDYFYQDTILPRALASVTGSTGGDFHEFDFERVRDSASLGIDVTPATRLDFDLDRYTRRGESTTTLDIQRDEFELDRPIDESLESYNVGVQHAFDNVTLVFERSGRDFENSSELFLPGASTGENTTDLADLQLFMLDQSYDYRSHGDLLRVIARPNDRLDIQAAWRTESLELDMDAAEQGVGTDFTGNPFTTDLVGSADVDREIELQQVDFGYGVSERLRVIGGIRRLVLDQEGALFFGGEQGTGAWEIETTGIEGGVELAAGERVVLGVGVSSESRDVSSASALGAEAFGGARETDRDGFFARVNIETDDGFEFVFSIEDDDIDDPYTLASPTSSRRYRLDARRRWDNGFALTASLRRDESENGPSGWAADTDQTNLRLTRSHERLRYSFGFAWIDLARSIDQTVTAGTRQDFWAIGYAADAELIDASVDWQINDRISIGGSFENYQNGGSFPLERDDARAYVELAVGQDYLVRLGYRGLDYQEDGFDDYDADLLEVAFGVRW